MTTGLEAQRDTAGNRPLPQLAIPQLGWPWLDRIAFGLIYGAVMVLSLLMAVDEINDAPFTVAIILFGSVLAITLARIFADLLAHAIETAERVLTVRAFWTAWRKAHPTLAVANLPALLFVAAGLGWLTAATATLLSQAWCILILVLFGARVGWVVSRGLWLTCVGAVCSGGIGSALAMLKYAIH